MSSNYPLADSFVPTMPSNYFVRMTCSIPSIYILNVPTNSCGYSFELRSIFLALFQLGLSQVVSIILRAYFMILRACSMIRRACSIIPRACSMILKACACSAAE